MPRTSSNQISSSGKLVILEGFNPVGRAELAGALSKQLQERGVPCSYQPCRSRAQGMAAVLVDPTALQLQELAARIDFIESTLRPKLQAGETLIVDGFWWSALLDGQACGAQPVSLEKMVDIERHHWRQCPPSVIVLLRAGQSGNDASHGELMNREPPPCPIREVAASDSMEETLVRILAAAPEITLRALPPVVPEEQRPEPPPARQQAPAPAQLDLLLTPQPERRHTHWVFSRHSSVRASKVFSTYWQFAAERQEVFFKRLTGAPPPWTDDTILGNYKFTNAYRASDRVSQFCIRNVIYKGEQTLEEVFFRTLLFKLFNKIDTWKLLEREFGAISYADYSFQRYDEVLTRALSRGARIYSAAYVMPAALRFEHPRKHGTHLQLLDHLMKEQVPQRMAAARNLRESFDVLRSYPMMGDFLAYQYLTDLNYSAFYDFKEDFIVPGPGARDGIRKCFEDLGGLTESQIIELVTDMQEKAFEELGLRFRSLWGRRLHLIDCQNLFCEVDKYARLAHPDVRGISGRTRIKQHYRYDAEPIEYWFPPKWGLNERIAAYMESIHRGGPQRDVRSA